MAETIKTFKVSDLQKIENISHDDLFLISDYDDGTCQTKKMRIDQLLSAIADDDIISTLIQDQTSPIGQAIKNIIQQKSGDLISAEVKRQLENDVVLSAHVLAIISANYLSVADMLDGVMDEQLTLRY